MGSDPAPFLPTYFFIIKRTDGSGRKIKRTDLRCARRFANVFHFIYYLAALNDGGEFEKSYKNIYPEEVELKRKITLHKKNHS